MPPHTTGSAIDVYLIDEHHHVVDMGIHLDDTYHDFESVYCKTQSNAISAAAQKNRDIMSHALNAVGFVNYPMEYWHWSYSDQCWVHQTHASFAIYDTKR